MLRISSDKPDTASNTNTPTMEANAPVATGAITPEAPVLGQEQDSTPSSTESRQARIEGNHSAHILPWLTEEIRFHAALDLGCGDGSAVKLLQEAGYDGHGIDLNPAAGSIANIYQGDFFSAPWENGTFDVVICCNVLHEIPNHRISEMLAEIDRLSNSYIMITTPSTECDAPQGEARSVAWWCDRISDFGWRYRIIREDPETGHMVILAEKPNSLASQILPLIDSGELDGSADATEQNTNTIVGILDQAVERLDQNDNNGGFSLISQLADMLLEGGINLEKVQPLFTEIITAMESQDIPNIIRLLRNELRPALINS